MADAKVCDVCGKIISGECLEHELGTISVRKNNRRDYSQLVVRASCTVKEFEYQKRNQQKRADTCRECILNCIKSSMT